MSNDSSTCVSWTGSSYCFDRRLVLSDSLLTAVDKAQFIGVSGPLRFIRNATDRIGGSYCCAQSVQATSNGAVHLAPILEYAISNHWKPLAEAPLLIWPGISLVYPLSRAHLRDVPLRIGVIESFSFTMITNVNNSPGQHATKLSGYVPDLIELLQEKMGFLPIIQVD